MVVIWLISVVNAHSAKWPAPGRDARQIVELGVPVAAAQRWALVRREVSPTGLKRKLKAQLN